MDLPETWYYGLLQRQHLAVDLQSTSLSPFFSRETVKKEAPGSVARVEPHRTHRFPVMILMKSTKVQTLSSKCARLLFCKLGGLGRVSSEEASCRLTQARLHLSG